ncbi:MAG: N-acetylneuraminate synthase family protein [Leptospiraceae bacterium]|nr:N-acetylneuraminate synthase family protein [Leptospiraceae bacterium]MCP5497269.1 N-acetylneuraminate synthase family protein [Leptospiraceae bacterium]
MDTFQNTIRINSQIIIGENEKPFIVAEIGLNHNNDLELGRRTIQAAKKSGANAVKFQSYTTEEFIDKNNVEAKFLFDIFKQYELNEKFHREFQKTATEEGLEFFSTPLCSSAVDLLVSLNVPILKIASGDLVNSQLLEKCASTKLPIFLSTGASEFFEIARSLEYLKSLDVKQLCLFHCVSLYPTPAENLNLKTIELFKKIVSCPVGFSDHSSGFLGAVIAIGLGASVIEKHFTMDKNLPGPDHTISADPNEFQEMVNHCQTAYQMLGKERFIPEKREIEGRFFGRRSLYQNESNQSWIPLRPAIHLKDKKFPEAWAIEKIIH